MEEEESLTEARYKAADTGDDASSSEDSDGEAEGESDKKKRTGQEKNKEEGPSEMI